MNFAISVVYLTTCVAESRAYLRGHTVVVAHGWIGGVQETAAFSVEICSFADVKCLGFICRKKRIWSWIKCNTGIWLKTHFVAEVVEHLSS